MVKLAMRYRADLVNIALRRRQFERTVERVVESLEPGIRSRLQNVDIVVEDEPPDSRVGDDDEHFYGLYEGIPLTERTSAYGMTLPDKITIFRGPLERDFAAGSELRQQIRITVLHELAHHFGIDEQRLAELGYE